MCTGLLWFNVHAEHLRFKLYLVQAQLFALVAVARFLGRSAPWEYMDKIL